MVATCFADIKSTNGVIKFDVNTDTQSEMLLKVLTSEEIRVISISLLRKWGISN